MVLNPAALPILPMKSQLRWLWLVALPFLVGCQNVKPWQRGTLADAVMRADRDPLGQGLTEHVFFSREAASGGRGCG